MIQVICDKCGKLLNVVTNRQTHIVYGDGEHDYQFCPDCASQLKKNIDKWITQRCEAPMQFPKSFTSAELAKLAKISQSSVKKWLYKRIPCDLKKRIGTDKRGRKTHIFTYTLTGKQFMEFLDKFDKSNKKH